MIKICKNGELFFKEDSSSTWNKCDVEAIMGIVLENYSEPCILEDGTTMGDLFNLLEKSPEIIPIVTDEDAPQFLEEMKKDQTELSIEMKYVEISWKPKESKGFIRDEIDVCGWCERPKGTPDVIAVDPDGNIPCGIGFNPVNILRNTPVILNFEYNVCKDEDDIIDLYVDNDRDDFIKKSKEINDQVDEVLFSSKKHFTISDIFDNIFYEISFYGNPDERDKFRGDIIELSQNSKDDVVVIYDSDDDDTNVDSSSDNIVDVEVDLEEKAEESKKSEEDVLNEIDDILGDIE